MVQGDEDGEHDGECPEGRAAVTHERERDADDRHDAYGHAHIDEKMHEQAACQTIAVNPGETLSTVLGIFYNLQNQKHIQRYDSKAAYEAPLLAHGAEDEIGTLFRDESVRRLSAVHIPLSGKTSRADGYH